MKKHRINGRGRIGWQDLTVGNAEQVRDFYSAVAGWQSQPLSMGEYDDYVMLSPDGESAVGGVCHARGVNANIPPVWMVYINVEDLDSSVESVTKLGGEIVDGPRELGRGSVRGDSRSGGGDLWVDRAVGLVLVLKFGRVVGQPVLVLTWKFFGMSGADLSRPVQICPDLSR